MKVEEEKGETAMRWPWWMRFFGGYSLQEGSGYGGGGGGGF